MKVNEPKIVKPKVASIETFENETLFQIIDNDVTANATTQCLAELLRRISTALAESNSKIEQLESDIAKLKKLLNPPKKRCGRKRECFIFNGCELDDDELLRLIDDDFITISKLEKDVSANKNVLRRRYERLKEKAKVEKYATRK